MRLSEYIKDKMFEIILTIVIHSLILMLLVVFKMPTPMLIMVEVLLIIYSFLIIMFDYFRKKKFYDNLITNLERLDKKYLILETIVRPEFYEGQILYDNLYEIDKSMCEYVKNYKEYMDGFKEYIEMWIHEVKLPLASLSLMCHNNREQIDKKFAEQIRRVDGYIEQVLYYVRAENAEKDYLIKEVELKKVIHSIAMKNKDDLLMNDIDLNVSDIGYTVLTDSKWLEFMINQIVSNSIKYKATDRKVCIEICAKEINDRCVLTIRDNGKGISANDLPRVFNKAFTGENGRESAKSTGMGLYIVSSLCKRLGHKISIDSREGEYTEVTLEFGKLKLV